MVQKYNEEELVLFRLLDEKKYLISHNPELKNWLNNLNLLKIENNIQKLINKIASWYIVKYSNQYLDFVYKKDNNYLVKLEPIKRMTINNFFQKLDTVELMIMNGKKYNEKFCQYLVQLSGYEMIYSENSIPEYGITRVKFMFDDFNKLYGWNLKLEIYDDIFNKDYSVKNENNICLLNNLNKNEREEKKKKSKLRYFLQR